MIEDVVGSSFRSRVLNKHVQIFECVFISKGISLSKLSFLQREGRLLTVLVAGPAAAEQKVKCNADQRGTYSPPETPGSNAEDHS